MAMYNDSSKYPWAQRKLSPIPFQGGPTTSPVGPRFGPPMSSPDPRVAYPLPINGPTTNPVYRPIQNPGRDYGTPQFPISTSPVRRPLRPVSKLNPFGATTNVLGSYAEGTPEVPETGPYELHEGEAVITVEQKQKLQELFDILAEILA